MNPQWPRSRQPTPGERLGSNRASAARLGCVGRNTSRLMSKAAIIALVLSAAVVIGGLVAFPRLLHRALESRNGPRHVFEMSGQTQFLDERVALERARHTLLLDGFTNEVWEPARDGRTLAPDGRADIYLARNTLNPKRGFLMFTNPQGAQIFLQLEIEGTSLVCQRVIGK